MLANIIILVHVGVMAAYLLLGICLVMYKYRKSRNFHKQCTLLCTYYEYMPFYSTVFMQVFYYFI